MADFTVAVEVVDEALEVVVEPSGIATEHEHEGYVRTVNDTAPDGDGNVDVSVESGVSDHGALTGLSDDDHTQYHTDARAATWGDSRYEPLDSAYTKAEADTRYVNETDHTKAAHDALALDHGSLSGLSDDDHTQYHNNTRGDARYSQLGHAHAASDVTSGQFAIARLASGTPDGTKFVRDDGVLAAPSGGSSYRTLVTLGSDVSTSSISASDVTGMSFSVTSGVTYRFEFTVIYEANLQTTGSNWYLDGPASPTLFGYTAEVPTGGNNAVYRMSNIYNDTSTSATTSSSTTTGNMMVMRGIIKPSTSGTLQLRFRTETATTTTITAKAGSCVEYW